MKLTAANVHNTLKACLFDDSTIANNEPPANAVIVEGVVSRFGFDPEKLAKQEENIRSMLGSLPEAFREEGGGGWSFLNACVDGTGQRWGEHRDIDSLLCLGIAVKAAKILLPREVWSALPGGLPYFSISIQEASHA